MAWPSRSRRVDLPFPLVEAPLRRASNPPVPSFAQRNIGPAHSRLTPALLTEIFESAVSVISPEDVASPGDLLLSITAVCQAWRQAALSEPGFWSSIIYVDATDRWSSLERVQAYLERSKGADVDLVVHLAELRGDGFSRMRLDRLNEIVEPHLHRCRSLDITLINTRGLVPFLPLSGFLPTLRALSIAVHGAQNHDTELDAEEAGDPANDELVLFEADALCRLRTLHVEASVDDPVSLFDIDSRSLENVHLNLPSLAHSDLLELLTLPVSPPHRIAIPKLRALTLVDVENVDETFDEEAEPIPAPSLVFLALEDCAIPLTTFDAPNLRTLHIGFQGGMSDYTLLFPSSPSDLFPELDKLVVGVIAEIPDVPRLVADFICGCDNLEEVEMTAEPSTVLLLSFFVPSSPDLSAMLEDDADEHTRLVFPSSLRTIRLMQLSPMDTMAYYPANLSSSSEYGDEQSSLDRKMLADMIDVLGRILGDGRGDGAECPLSVEWVQGAAEEGDTIEAFPEELLDLRDSIGEERLRLRVA